MGLLYPRTNALIRAYIQVLARMGYFGTQVDKGGPEDYSSGLRTLQVPVIGKGT